MPRARTLAAAGKEMQKPLRVNARYTPINVSGMAEGMYLLIAETKKHTTFSKLVLLK